MSDVFLLGDIHGDLKIIYTWLNKFAKKGDVLIQLGDFGAGFINLDEFEDLSNSINDKGVKVYVVRGNHDDPEWFNVESNIKKPINFVSDYTTININGLKYQLIGGAISIDRCYRREGRDYWKNEQFYLDTKKVHKDVDVLITHTAPNEARPYYGMGDHPDIKHYQSKDEALKRDLEEESKNIQKLFEIVQPTLWAFGHFHKYSKKIINNTEFLCLGINELEMIRI